MVVVEQERIGPVAFARLARDGALHEVLGSRGLPLDVTSTRALRAYLIAPLVPAQTWLTGLAALWVYGLSPVPHRIDLAGKRGLHISVEDGYPLPFAVHTGPLAGLSAATDPLPIATVPRACVDALAHSPASGALPATASALRSGATTVGELKRALAAVSRHTAYRTRVASLVGALEGP